MLKAAMKVLCIPYTHALSHVSRPLAVAVELRRRGHEIVFAGEGNKLSFVQQDGFQTLPLFEPDPRVLYDNIRQRRLRFVSDADIDLMLEADLELYSKTKPDLVLTDGRFTAPISCHIASVKHAAIVNASSTEFRALPYVPLFDRLPEMILPRDSKSWKNMDRLNLYLEMLVFNQAMKTFAALSKKYKLSRKITATNCLAGKDLTLLPDVPEYFPTRNLPSSYHYIGPLTLQQPRPLPAWWTAAIKQKKKIIYLTMGTTGLSAFFERAVNYLKDINAIVIITTGGLAGISMPLPDHIYAEDYLDGDAVMAAASLVICHGGNGTIYQALKMGKPVIGIPTIPDQDFNMRQVVRLGAGITVTSESYARDATTLLAAIDTVLTSKEYTANARLLQNKIETYNAPVAAADLMEKLMSDKEFHHV